jgi:putative transposase
MSQNKVTTTCWMQQELAQKLTTKLNPKADPDAVAAKKKRLKHCWQTTERKSKQES